MAKSITSGLTNDERKWCRDAHKRTGSLDRSVLLAAVADDLERKYGEKLDEALARRSIYGTKDLLKIIDLFVLLKKMPEDDDDMTLVNFSFH